jgi:hypothetical protein
MVPIRLLFGAARLVVGACRGWAQGYGGPGSVAIVETGFLFLILEFLRLIVGLRGRSGGFWEGFRRSRHFGRVVAGGLLREVFRLVGSLI